MKMNTLIDDYQWKDDLNAVLQLASCMEMLRSKKILITGASGLICSSVVDLLLCHNENTNAGVEVVAAGRNVEKLTERFSEYGDKNGIRYVSYDAVNPAPGMDDMLRSVNPDYIIHGASNAHPQAYMHEPVDTMLTNITGTQRLLQLAKDCGTERFLFISSSEVYGKKEKGDMFREDDYGYIDILNPRNAYGMGKRAAETLCAAFREAHGTDFVVVRPGHIYGPSATKEDTRVSSAWAYAAARGEDIVMKSGGRQLRSYCYCVDCASAILTVLIKGESGQAYNVSNPDSVITIREMAVLLAQAGHVRLKSETPSDEEKRGFNPMDNASLDSTKLESLGWKGIFDAPTGMQHTVDILKHAL